MAAGKHFGTPRPGTVLTAAYVRDVVRELERLGRISVGPGLELRDNPGGIYIGLVIEPDRRYARAGAGGVPAMSGTTMGSATVRLQNNAGAVLSDGGVDVTAYNISTVAVAANKYLIVEKVGISWSVVVESCG